MHPRRRAQRVASAISSSAAAEASIFSRLAASVAWPIRHTSAESIFIDSHLVSYV